MNGISILGNIHPQIEIPSTYILTSSSILLTDVKWTLYENGKPILKKDIGTFTFQKNSLGKSYRLVATYTMPLLRQSSRSEINITPEAGPPEITKVTWEDCNFKDLAGRQVGYLDTVYLVIQTKNIPYGKTISVTVWEDEYADGHGDSSRNMGTLTARVGKNGRAELILNSTLLKAYQKTLNDKDWFDESEHEYYVQIKYVGRVNTIQDKTQLKVKNKLEKLVKPDNSIKPLTIEDDKGLIYGLVRPIKAEFKTDYDVCHDIVGDFNDYANFFVLESEGKFGYHWLGPGMTRTVTDQTKPNEIPITIPSTEQLTVTITVVSHTESSISLRLKDKQGNYIFANEQKHRGKGKAEYKFTSTNATPPFKDHVRYFGIYNFGLEFSFEESEGTWLSAGANICVRLYITKKTPLFGNLSAGPSDHDKTNYLKNQKNASKNSILETLLYIGCKYADKESIDSKIVDKIFDHFKSLNVQRTRIAGTMTYWKKNEASGLTQTKSMAFRNGRYLLKYGEARCGEWTSFFQDICKIQGIAGFDDFVITPTKLYDTDGYQNLLFLVKSWTTPANILKAPVNQGGRAQDVSNQPLNLFWDHVFAKYDGKYFDPSYGLTNTTKFTDDKILLDDYSQAGLTAVVYAKGNITGEAIHDHLHSGLYIAPTGKTAHSPNNSLNYEYKYIKKSMQNELVIITYSK